MNEESRQFLMQFRKMLFELYNLDEIETLCFDLGVDYDDLQGRAKQTKINSLITAMARHGRLPELLDYVRADRSHVVWPDIPADFQLPQGSGEGELATTTIINTGGGTVIHGGVNTGGGSFSGRDTIVQGDQTGATTYTMSGDFRGAIVNLQSRLDNVTQEIGDSKQGTPDQRVNLVRLVNELRHELALAPPEQVADADAIARRVEVLADEVRNETPDQSLVLQIGESLRKAAEKLAPRLPRVLPIVTAIVELVKVIVKMQ